MVHAVEQSYRPASPNLPYQLTSFIGRAVELAELRRMLPERRLVTLTGPGGSGKTRLAIEAAGELASEFPEGVFLVDLAPLGASDLVPETVARVLGIEIAPARSVLDALAQHLCGRAVLLVLDNCEHLLDGCARLAAALLAACPDLRVLTTSREPLGVGGEAIFRVPLLSFPDPDSLPALDEMMEFEAVQLFVDRARLAEPGFSLTPSNAPAVAQVCARLDGIPLALELAAASLRAVSIFDLAARLDQRFRLLTTRGRTVLPRHKTLGALLDWSHGLLDEREVAVFRHLAVFPGDWTLDAAEYVCAAGIAQPEALDVILQLVNKSLVQVNHATGRYRLLETIRLYALDKLTEAGETESAARRHFDWYLQFADQAALRFGGPEQQGWFLRLEGEQANLRAALDWAIEGDRGEESARLALTLAGFWSPRGYQREAYCWFERVLALNVGAPFSPQLRAQLLSCLGLLAQALNEFEKAERDLGEALSIWQQQGNNAGMARALGDLSWVHFQKMDLAGARRYAEESLALGRVVGEPATLARALNLWGIASVEAGWMEGLVPTMEECLAIWRALGDLPQVASALITLARVEQRSGNIDRAATLMLEALGIQALLGDYSNLIGYLVLMTGFEFDARKPIQQPPTAGSYDLPAYLTHGKLLHGPVEATRVLGAMAGWQDRIIGARPPQWDAMVVPVCEKLKAEMGEAAFDREFAAGREMSIDDIVGFAQEYARSVLSLSSSMKGPAVSPGPQRGPSDAASTGRRKTALPEELTTRETEVLRLVAAGLTNRQAAERLVVTPRTINAHLTSIYSKIGVNSRAAAVRYAVEHGLT